MLTQPEKPKSRVLVVDDTPDNILLLSETLKETYHVQVANNGPRAIQLAQKTPAPDLILLDVMMPEMDGYEVCRILKADPATARIPIIFVTALTSSGDEELGLGLGAVDYVTKPFNPTLVLSRVRNQLELKLHRDHLEEEVRRRTEELVAETLARQRLEGDLQVAKQLQISMLRSARQQKADYSVAAYLQPARMIGGDLYDYVLLDERRLLFAVGDVSDKGVAAALFMVRVLTLLRWIARTANDPAQLLFDLNQALCQENDACMFVTLGLGILDLQSGEVEYASGGHEPPILFTAGQPARALELESGPALGLFEAEFPLHRLSLSAEQCLMLLSDGVSEANNPAKEEFSLDRLVAMFPVVDSVDPDVVLRKSLQGVEEFIDGAEPSDDLTALLLRPA